MNYKNFGNQPTDSRGGGGRPGNFPLTRQGSIYSLTLDELQNTMGSIGKDFGSMNMDELLKNIWNAEEELQTMGNNMAVVQDRVGVSGTGTGLQRQGSLTLPRTLSQKTVDEVWKDLSKEYNSVGFGQPDLHPQRQQQTLGEMTLEEFLVKAGVVRDDPPGLGQISFQSGNLPLSGNGVRTGPPPLYPKQQTNLGYGGPPMAIPTGNQNGVMNGMGLMGGTGGVTVVAGSPPDGLGKSNGGDTSSVSPVPYVFDGVFKGRKNGAIEKVLERRQRRMIKNRESAARSRARKQAYTMELEAEVSELKRKNQELKRKQEEMLKMQKNQVMEMMNMKPGAKRNRLKKTISGPW